MITSPRTLRVILNPSCIAYRHALAFSQAGWFALERTELPSPQQFARLQKVLGEGGASDALKPPDTWQECSCLIRKVFGGRSEPPISFMI